MNVSCWVYMASRSGVASFQMGRYREAKNSFLEGQKLGGEFLKICSVMLFVSSKNNRVIFLGYLCLWKVCSSKPASHTYIYQLGKNQMSWTRSYSKWIGDPDPIRNIFWNQSINQHCICGFVYVLSFLQCFYECGFFAVPFIIYQTCPKHTLLLVPIPLKGTE